MLILNYLACVMLSCAQGPSLVLCTFKASDFALLKQMVSELSEICERLKQPERVVAYPNGEI